MRDANLPAGYTGGPMRHGAGGPPLPKMDNAQRDNHNHGYQYPRRFQQHNYN